MTLKSFDHWNYRVVKTTHTYPDGSTETTYAIHEACYGEPDELSDSSRRRLGWTSEPVAAVGGNLRELRDVLHRMLVALEIDVIEGAEVPREETLGDVLREQAPGARANREKP